MKKHLYSLASLLEIVFSLILTEFQIQNQVYYPSIHAHAIQENNTVGHLSVPKQRYKKISNHAVVMYNKESDEKTFFFPLLLFYVGALVWLIAMLTINASLFFSNISSL